MRVRLRQDALRDLLARSRRSQNAWALRIGISRGHWSDIVNGKHPYPSARTRAAMLDALGVELDALFAIESGAAEPAVSPLAELDRYVVDRELAEGAMGTVHLARDGRFGRPVAIKVMSDEALCDLGPQRFLQEIRRAGRLVHPHVLPLLDAGESGGRAWYAMPYVEGGSLRQRLEARGRLSLRQTLSIARGVAAALDHAHGLGILHCDIKPENVLLVGDHALVADFGLSRAIHVEAVREWDTPPEIDVGAGTPAYVSPEQARAASRLDGRSDVFSLACMIFEMLAGRAPFTGRSTTDVVRRRFEELPPRLQVDAPELPDEIARVLERALAVDPDSRPATPGDLVARLEAAVGLASSAAATPSSEPLAATLRAVGRWAITRPSRSRGRYMNGVLEDLRYSLRSLARKPLFAIAVVITLALGIGANAAFFSVIEAVLLRPLPYAQVDRMVRVYSTFEGRLCCSISPPNFVDMRDQSSRFDHLVAYGGGAFSLSGGGEPVRLSGQRVTPGYFEMLETTPRIGRFFTDQDATFGAEGVVVLSERLWADRYDRDPGVLGEVLTLDSAPHTVIGVAPTDPRLIGQPNLFTPFVWDPENMPGRGNNQLNMIGRVAAGTSIEAAMAELESIYGRLVEQYPDNIINRGVGHLTFAQWLGASDNRRTQLLVLWGAVGMVLLVACVNVMNLMLARAESRQRELAVRSALGAGRGRLLRHFLTESLLLSLTGGALGIGLGYAGLQALVSVYGQAVPRGDEIALNGPVLGFALAASLLAGLIVGVVPGLQSSRSEISGVLREGGRESAGGASRLRRVLVVVEVAMALILVVGAGLLLRSLWNISRVDMGVEAERFLSVSISLPQARYAEQPDIAGFFERLCDDVARLPEVEGVTLGSATPFSNTYTNYSVVTPVGQPDRKSSFVESRRVDPEFFATLDLDFLAGATFDGSETLATPPVVVVNRTLAEQLFGDEPAIGTEITPSPTATPWTIIGVVEDLRDHGPERRTPPTVFFSLAQGWPGTLRLIVRTAGDPMAAVPAIRSSVARLDADLPLYEVESLDGMIRAGLGSRRFAMSLLVLFASIGLVLGAIGIYGVMAYTVERRTREIGLRQALGASSGSVLQLVVGQGTGLALVGIGLGSVGAYLLRGYLETQLYEVEAFDLSTYAAVATALLLVAAAACLLPARRAAAVDPMEALREE